MNSICIYIYVCVTGLESRDARLAAHVVRQSRQGDIERGRNMLQIEKVAIGLGESRPCGSRVWLACGRHAHQIQVCTRLAMYCHFPFLPSRRPRHARVYIMMALSRITTTTTTREVPATNERQHWCIEYSHVFFRISVQLGRSQVSYSKTARGYGDKGTTLTYEENERERVCEKYAHPSIPNHSLSRVVCVSLPIIPCLSAESQPCVWLSWYRISIRCSPAVCMTPPPPHRCKRPSRSSMKI